MSDIVRSLYVRLIRPRIDSQLGRQRIKMVWLAWAYWKIFKIRAIPFHQRIVLLIRFLEIDWNVLHSHWPSEIAEVCLALGTRMARNGEAMVEAGCWNGGSTAKFSLLCSLLGYKLFVYDSFQGVRMTEEERAISYDFSGQYAASEDVVRENVGCFGKLDVCTFHPGWFSESFSRPVLARVRVAFIDCDTAEGTRHALAGIIPSLVVGGQILSQDFAIHPVRQMLVGDTMWQKLEMARPPVQRIGKKLARIQWLAPSDPEIAHRNAAEAERQLRSSL
jgi:O-methyltransferase